AVAPGQAVTTVICLIVKEGSSARPKVRNATTPAIKIATSRNKVTDRSRTARAERLKPLMAAGRRFAAVARARPRAADAHRVRRRDRRTGDCRSRTLPRRKGGRIA